VIAVLSMAALELAGCTTERLTEPSQTATEQLLVSTAVDHAIEKLKAPLAPGAKVFLDPQFFDMADANVVLPKYTIGAVRDWLLKHGARLVDDRKNAEVIVELRNGAQSVDHKSLLVGIPSIPVPIPLAGTITTPELALFKRDRQHGISKIAVTAYDAKSGSLTTSSGATYGKSEKTGWTVLLMFSWDTQNIMPENGDEPAAAP
jgi:hypothetical protein